MKAWLGSAKGWLGHRMRVMIKQVWKRSILKLEERRGWIKNKEQQQQQQNV